MPSCCLLPLRTIVGFQVRLTRWPQVSTIYDNPELRNVPSLPAWKDGRLGILCYDHAVRGRWQNEFRPAEEIHSSDTLCELIQRSISNRSGDIADYLKRQKQRLFNSIIAGVYDGDPQWYELELPDSESPMAVTLPADLRYSMGSLRLTGEERIFAIDGQHRVEGIKRALLEKESLGEEQQVVIFVAHSSSKTGLVRSRRLFATLNRYAKPVSKFEIIALDEDDPIAITTRVLLRDHKLLSKPGVVSTSKGKSMPTSDDSGFTTAVVLYEGILSYVTQTKQIKGKQLKEYLAARPPDKEPHCVAPGGRLDLRPIFEKCRVIKKSTFPVFRMEQNLQPPNSEIRTNGGTLLFRTCWIS